jgi:hypothetical protein
MPDQTNRVAAFPHRSRRIDTTVESLTPPEDCDFCPTTKRLLGSNQERTKCVGLGAAVTTIKSPRNADGGYEGLCGEGHAALSILMDLA